MKRVHFCQRRDQRPEGASNILHCTATVKLDAAAKQTFLANSDTNQKAPERTSVRAIPSSKTTDVPSPPEQLALLAGRIA